MCFLPVSPTNRFNRVLVLVVLWSLLFLLCLLLCTGCAAGVTNGTRVAPPAHAPAPCSPAGNVPSVTLFVHRPGSSDEVRCLSRDRGSTPGQPTHLQLLTPPIAGVTRVCASHADASVAYASYEDPQVRAREADGGIDLLVQAGTCQSVAQAVALPSMTVTDVWIAPSYGGIRSDAPSPSSLHQVNGPMCAHRSDFFTIWADGGRRKACFANAGQLTLAAPLSGVTKVCSGNNAGGVLFHATQISGVVVNLEPNTCATMAALLQESSITIDTVLIAPPQHE